MIDKELLKSFKDGLALQSFFRELQARAVSQMLEREMDGHFGYEKYERSAQAIQLLASPNEEVKREL